MREGYALNIPLRPAVAAPSSEVVTSSLNWLEVSAPNIIVETVKRSEDKRGIVVRLYECTGARTQATLSFAFGVETVALTDLDERNPMPLAAQNDAVTLDFGPFEIHTLKINGGRG